MKEIVGKSNGHFRFKENRAQKLLDQWNKLQTKMIDFINDGHGITLRARCAYGVLLMMDTGVRIGNEESAEGYVCINKFSEHFGKTVQTFGLTTLRCKHVVLEPESVELRFNGKKGVAQNLTTLNPIIRKFADTLLRGKGDESLFLGITAGELTKFVKKSVGRGFMPKDLRTAKVNLLFIREVNNLRPVLREQGLLHTKAQVKKCIAAAIEATAEEIGHTKGVCKSRYISKQLLLHYLNNLQEN